jgi:hypothetical protein
MDGCSAGSATDVGVELAEVRSVDGESAVFGGSPPEHAASSSPMAENLAAVIGDSSASR